MVLPLNVREFVVEMASRFLRQAIYSEIHDLLRVEKSATRLGFSEILRCARVQEARTDQCVHDRGNRTRT